MSLAKEFQRCMEEMDCVGYRDLWRKFSPHLYQPKNDEDARVTLHNARTQCNSIAFDLRAYSHRWLTERGFPSGLPDNLKPKAERLYPRVVSAVGISVNAKSEFMKPIVGLVRNAMEHAVLDAYADGREEPVFVKQRMMEARERTIQKLLGSHAPSA